mmetsp:Transcript_43014/g.93645  ORF Transcript_43014/g.93645 Transcript_43014/m.93645 type:complete len:222 (+) Transcript_43014:630-1295(+)
MPIRAPKRLLVHGPGERHAPQSGEASLRTAPSLLRNEPSLFSHLGRNRSACPVDILVIEDRRPQHCQLGPNALLHAGGPRSDTNCRAAARKWSCRHDLHLDDAPFCIILNLLLRRRWNLLVENRLGLPCLCTCQAIEVTVYALRQVCSAKSDEFEGNLALREPVVKHLQGFLVPRHDDKTCGLIVDLITRREDLGDIIHVVAPHPNMKRLLDAVRERFAAI